MYQILQLFRKSSTVNTFHSFLVSFLPSEFEKIVSSCVSLSIDKFEKNRLEPIRKIRKSYKFCIRLPCSLLRFYLVHCFVSLDIDKSEKNRLVGLVRYVRTKKHVSDFATIVV